MAQAQSRPAPVPVAVGKWKVTYFDKDGKEASAVQEGRLVLQDHWTLVLAPSDRRVLLAVPNVNVGPVTPA